MEANICSDFLVGARATISSPKKECRQSPGEYRSKRTVLLTVSVMRHALSVTLVVQFPMLIAHTQMDQDSINALRENLVDVLK